MGIETKTIDDPFPVTTLRREEGGVSETLTVSKNVSGTPDETYQVRQEDGTSVTIHGDEVVVADPQEEDIRYYRLGRGAGELRFVANARLHRTPSDGTLSSHVDQRLAERDRIIIQGALKLYADAKSSPEGFEEGDPFERRSI
jgi:hypothetical protein